MVVVIVDRPCRAIEVAEGAGVPAELVERETYGADFDRAAYTHRVVDALKHHESTWSPWPGSAPSWPPAIFDAYPGRILNTHPALLPAFKGWHAVRDALAAGRQGDRLHACTWPPPRSTTGPILAQEAVAVLPGDTEATPARADQGGRAPAVPRDHPSFLDQQEGAAR